MSISIEVNDGEVGTALQSLYDALGNIDPALKEIGEVLVDSTKQRFKTATAPDGTQWEDNAESTLINYASRFKTSFTKSGRISKKGRQRIANKLPGTGETKQLQTQIFYNVKNGVLEVGSPLIYSATFHFGAKKGQYGEGVPWGKIPGRKVVGLSKEDQTSINDIIPRYLGLA